MNITAETRAALLEGSAYGFPNVETAPKHFQDRIVEVRAALAEKRDVPAPSRAYAQAAEQRSLLGHAKGFARRLFPTLRKGQSLQDLYLEQTGREYRPTPVRKPNAAKPTVRSTDSKQTAEQLSKRYNIPVERIEDADLRLRAKRLGEEIAAYNLPTGPMTADEREQMKRRLDVAMGLREPERFPWQL